MRAIIRKQQEFSAAHHLPGYKGACSRVHGHTWKVKVSCSGPISSKSGMVVDFKELKGFFSWVDGKFDHQNLNSFIKNPTAENIALYILTEFTLWCISRGLSWESLEVWESEDSSITLVREAIDD